ncbi:unnamed protein product [Clonostachys rosea]|uniref:Uncharacterized protein n=1 Tax=Bionectria ochroleuca TaxID=29856 RepID=A0ABY6TX09_BIOOC|nr:unnamed protein product [Clonostachys rosea]
MSDSRKISALVTGCTPGGIGHALISEYQRRGCYVIATARNPAVLEELTRQGFTAVRLDVTNQESIAQCKQEVEKLTGGRLDILVNNAGRDHTIPALDIDIEDVKATYDANVFGPMAMVSAFSSLLVPARGLIVNNSSISSRSWDLFCAAYGSSKVALNIYSRALRLELQPLGVRVMVLVTGTIRSNIVTHQQRSLPPGSYYEPVDDVFKWKIWYSQETETMPAEVYAKRVVSETLKGEGWLGGLIGGTPYELWYGGLATGTWLFNFLPERVAHYIFSLYWGIAAMKRRMDAAREKKQT